MSDAPDPASSIDSPGPVAASPVRKLVLFAIVLALVVVVYSQFRDTLTLQRLAEHESTLREYRTTHPILVYGAAFLLYVTITALSIPGATAMSLAMGWFFGFLPAVVLVSFASTTGATLAFLLSRYLLRDSVQQKFGGKLAGIERALEREGAFYLFTLRLLPVVPFFVINLVMGLTPLRVWTFWWVSQVGMLPGTSIYVYAGSQVPELQQLAEKGVGQILNWQTILAFTLLGLFPITIKKIMQFVRSARSAETAA